MHTCHRIDFQGNFPENRSISEKANYSTDNSGNFRTELKWIEKSGWDISENLGEPRGVVRLSSRKFWEMLFHSPLEIFKTETFAMRWKILIWTFEIATFDGWNMISGIFKKRGQPFQAQRNFWIFFIYGWMFLFLEIQQFPDCLKTCHGNFYTIILTTVQKFSEFSFERKAPQNFRSNRKLPTSFRKQSNCLFHGCKAWKAWKN